VEAQLAKLREYTELFRIVDEKDAMRSRLFKALRRRGLRCWRAGAYHYLVTATAGCAESLRMLKAIWRQEWDDPFIIGFGDSEDDVTWLKHVDVAIIVQNHRACVPVSALSKLPAAHVTRLPGRQGWSDAVFEFVGGLLTPRAQTQSTGGLQNRTHARADGRPP